MKELLYITPIRLAAQARSSPLKPQKVGFGPQDRTRYPYIALTTATVLSDVQCAVVPFAFASLFLVVSEVSVGISVIISVIIIEP